MDEFDVPVQGRPAPRLSLAGEDPVVLAAHGIPVNVPPFAP